MVQVDYRLKSVAYEDFHVSLELNVCENVNSITATLPLKPYAHLGAPYRSSSHISVVYHGLHMLLGVLEILSVRELKEKLFRINALKYLYYIKYK